MSVLNFKRLFDGRKQTHYWVQIGPLVFDGKEFRNTNILTYKSLCGLSGRFDTVSAALSYGIREQESNFSCHKCRQVYNGQD